MIKNITKVSLLVLLMASSVTFTSCKKDEAPTPDNTEQDAKDKAEQDAKDKAEQDAKDKAEQDAKDKAEQEAKEKARVEKILVNDWIQDKDPLEKGIVGLSFKADNSLKMSILDKRFTEFIGVYSVSKDGKQLTLTIEGNDVVYNITVTEDSLIIEKDGKSTPFKIGAPKDRE